MKFTEMLENWVKESAVFLVMSAIVLVYYIIKSYTPYGLTVTWNEVLLFFLMYEFGATRKMVAELRETICTYYIYNKVQMDKIHGKITDEDIAHSMEDGND